MPEANLEGLFRQNELNWALWDFVLALALLTTSVSVHYDWQAIRRGLGG